MFGKAKNKKGTEQNAREPNELIVPIYPNKSSGILGKPSLEEYQSNGFNMPVVVKLDGVESTFYLEIDTGSSCTIISQSNFNARNIDILDMKAKSEDVRLADGDVMHIKQVYVQGEVSIGNYHFKDGFKCYTPVEAHVTCDVLGRDFLSCCNEVTFKLYQERPQMSLILDPKKVSAIYDSKELRVLKDKAKVLLMQKGEAK